jgi:hypothetical protein
VRRALPERDPFRPEGIPQLEPVRQHVESSESVVIQSGGVIRLGLADVDQREPRSL